MVVRQTLMRLLKAHPCQLIHLIVGPELTSERAHQPVSNPLWPTLRAVCHLRQRGAEFAFEPRFLLHFPESALLVAFPALCLALRKAPVVVLRPVDDQDLCPGAALPHDDAPRGADECAPLKAFFPAF